MDEICDIIMDYASGIPEANARLIASAPDMAEACRLMLESVRDYINSDDADLGAMTSAMMRAEHALKSAGVGE